MTSSNDGTARVWDLPPAPDGEVPEWVAGWAEALVDAQLEPLAEERKLVLLEAKAR